MHTNIDLFNNIRMLDGGKGSGNFGHKGRPGKRGGSGKGVSKILDDSQIQSVWEEYVKRVNALGENDQYGWSYGWISENSFNSDKKKIGEVLNNIIDKNEGLFKDDAAVEECEKAYENAVANGDKKTAEKLKKMLRYNMTIEAMYDIACDMYGEEISEVKEENNKTEEPSNNEILVDNINKKINGFDISNDSDIYNEKGECQIQTTDLDLSKANLGLKTDDWNMRFNNLLLLNKSEFINFCNSENKDIKQYKENSEQYLKELKDVKSDLFTYLDYPSLIDDDNKNKIFSIAYNNYNLGDILKESDNKLLKQDDVDILYKPEEISKNDKMEIGITPYVEDLDINKYLERLKEKRGEGFINNEEPPSEEKIKEFCKMGIVIAQNMGDIDFEDGADEASYLFMGLDGLMIKNEWTDYPEYEKRKMHELSEGFNPDVFQNLNQFLNFQLALLNCDGLNGKKDVEEIEEIITKTFGMTVNSLSNKSYKTSMNAQKNAMYQAAKDFLSSDYMQMFGFSRVNLKYDDKKNNEFCHSFKETFEEWVKDEAVAGIEEGMDMYFDLLLDRYIDDYLGDRGVSGINDILAYKAAYNQVRKMFDVDDMEFNEFLHELTEKYKQLCNNEMNDFGFNEEGSFETDVPEYRDVIQLSDFEADCLSAYAFKMNMSKEDLFNYLWDNGFTKKDLQSSPNKDIVEALLDGTASVTVSNSIDISSKMFASFCLVNKIDVDKAMQLLDANDKNAYLKNIDKKADFNSFNQLPLLDKNVGIKIEDKRKADLLLNMANQMDISLNQLNNLYQNYNNRNASKTLNDIDTSFLSDRKWVDKNATKIFEALDKFGWTEQGVLRIQNNLKKHGAFRNDEAFSEDLLYSALLNMVKNGRKNRKDLLDRFNRLHAQGDFLFTSEDECKNAKIYTKDFENIGKDIKDISGNLIKTDTSKLDSFINDLSNIKYKDDSVTFNNWENDILFENKKFKSSDFCGLNISIKDIEDIKRIDSDLTRKRIADIKKAMDYFIKYGLDKFDNKKNIETRGEFLDRVKEAYNFKINNPIDKYAALMILKNQHNISDKAFKNRNPVEFFNKLLPKKTMHKPTDLFKDLNFEKLPSMLKANRIAERYKTIQNKPDIKSNVLNTTTLKDVKMDNNFSREQAVNLINKMFPTLNIPNNFYKDLILGRNVYQLQKGREAITGKEADTFEEINATNSRQAGERQASSQYGIAEPVMERLYNKIKNKKSYSYNDLRSLIRLITTSGYHYTSALQEDNEGMGSFMRTVVASSPVYEGEFLRCESASDLYRDYENMKEGDEIVFNSQHFTYDARSFGKDAASMFGEIGFRLKGKVPFLNMMPYVDKDKMTEWEGLIAGCFKIKKITPHTELYGAKLEKLIDIEFDWDKWKDYIHANAKLFGSKIGLYDRNGKMKAKDFLNRLIKKFILGVKNE